MGRNLKKKHPPNTCQRILCSGIIKQVWGPTSRVPLQLFFEASSGNLLLISLCFRRFLPLEIQVVHQSLAFRLSEKHPAERKKKNFEHFVPRSLFSAHYRQLVCRTERTKRNSCTRKKLIKYSEIKKRLKRFVRSLQILHIIKSWKIRTIWHHSIGVVSGTW